jgi:hypothetical protein
MQVMNAFGDLFDIVPAVTGVRPDFAHMTGDEAKAYAYSHGHCSAFVRVRSVLACDAGCGLTRAQVTPDLSAMYSGHSAWFDYSAMTRILKAVTFAFHLPTACV